MQRLDYVRMFQCMHPGFFQREYIQSIPKDKEYEEMILWLKDFSVDAVKIDVPPEITFEYFRGDADKLLEAVRQVEEGWAPIYEKKPRTFCAYHGDRIVSFCIIEDMKSYENLKIGGPGCVGTVPDFRKKGVGLRMVQLATDILKQEGFDISYIHYTGVARWYAKLGYEPILKWNGEGILQVPHDYEEYHSSPKFLG